MMMNNEQELLRKVLSQNAGLDVGEVHTGLFLKPVGSPESTKFRLIEFDCLKFGSTSVWLKGLKGQFRLYDFGRS
jgi:hypothetical protein